jgi:diguanylate cyclase (GGDEF)-like protein
MDAWVVREHKARRSVLIALALALVGVIGLLDYVTGWEVYFSTFYLAPVCFAAWFMGRGVGALVAVLSAAAGWWAVYLQTGHTFSHPAIPYWNVAARLCLFLLAALAVGALRRALVHARTDPLTGLPNSRAFHEAAETEMNRAHRYRRPFTIAVLDIDGFKRVNDQLGHARGDEVLKGVANTLSGSLRASDVAARLGGDEFALLLPEAGEEAARRALKKVHAALTAAVRGLRPEVGFSIGAATFALPPASLLVALGRADEPMYSAKRSAGSGIRHEALPPLRSAETA